MCELCTVPRPPEPALRGRPDPATGDPRRPQGVWPHLSGVRGALSLVPLPARPTPPDAGGPHLRLVLRGDVTRQVLAWSDDLGPEVLARVRVVCTADLTHLDDAGRALLVELVQVAVRQRQRLHLPEPSAAATTVLARYGLLAAVDTGPDPWPSRDPDDGGGLASSS